MKSRLTLLVLVIIFFIFCILRFYDLPHRAIFNWDQEQFSFQIYNLIHNHHPTLLGPRVSNDFGFYLAPYFTYLLAPFYFVTRLHPVGMLLFLIAVNCTFFFLSYKVISRLFSSTHALFFLFLWTISSSLQQLETVAWWPILIPPGVMIMWYMQSRIYKHPQIIRLWTATGLLAGLFMNMHFQFIFILTQLGLFFLLLKIKNKQIPLRNFVALMISFGLMFTPLFIFDLRNHFLNSQLFFNYFLHKDTIYAGGFGGQWPFIFAILMAPYIFVRTVAAGTIAFATMIGATIYGWRKSSGFKSLFYLTHAVMILCAFIGFTIMGIRPSEYYFLFLIPIFLISLIDLALENKLILPLVAFCIIATSANMASLTQHLNPHFDSLRYKDDLVKEIQHQVGNKKFFISFGGPPGSDTGFRYLILIRGLNSSSDGRNPQIQVWSPPPDPKNAFGGFGIIYPPELERKR